MILIRPYTKEDHQMLDGWNKEMGLGEFHEEFISPTTFVAEVNDIPVLAISLVLTNSPAVAVLENLVGNPALAAERREALPILVNHATEYAKMFGVKRIFMNAYVDKLKDKYAELGFKELTNNLSLLYKQIGGI